jgi:ubiquitin C-terminal hydrolase
MSLYSKFHLFYAIHVSELISVDTNTRINITPEPFSIIDLPIPNNNKSPTLIDCFNLFIEGEILDGDNCWYNEETKKCVRKNTNCPEGYFYDAQEVE